MYTNEMLESMKKVEGRKSSKRYPRPQTHDC